MRAGAAAPGRIDHRDQHQARSRRRPAAARARGELGAARRRPGPASHAGHDAGRQHEQREEAGPRWRIPASAGAASRPAAGRPRTSARRRAPGAASRGDPGRDARATACRRMGWEVVEVVKWQCAAIDVPLAPACSTVNFHIASKSSTVYIHSMPERRTIPIMPLPLAPAGGGFRAVDPADAAAGDGRRPGAGAEGPRHGLGHRAPVRERRPRGCRRRLGRARPGRRRTASRARHHRHRGALPAHPQHQRFARHQLRRRDQPLSRLRARLHLLLRAAHAQLPQHVAGPRLRDPHHRQGQCRRTPARSVGQAGLRAPVHQHRLGHRRLPAGRAQAGHHARRHRGAGRGAASASPSSPSRRAWSATSTWWARWAAPGWPRSTCRSPRWTATCRA